jgi:FixJ family two-component response regulator
MESGIMIDLEPIVFVVDDDPSVRRALARLIGSAGFSVQAFACACEFLACDLSSGRPACLVLDVRLPDFSGLELQQRLNRAGAALPIVFITGHGDIPMTVTAMKAGAADFLEKPVSDEDLLRAIDVALARSREALCESVEIDAIRLRLTKLTPREREVFALVVKGRLNKQVASELGTVEKTVKVHRARVMEKMGAHSLAELVRLSDKAGDLSIGSVHPSSE